MCLCFGGQGAELMSKYGVNVPKGVAVGSTDEIKKAIQEVFPNETEVWKQLWLLVCFFNEEKILTRFKGFQSLMFQFEHVFVVGS